MKKIIIMFLITISITFCFTTPALAKNQTIEDRKQQVKEVIDTIPKEFIKKHNIYFEVQYYTKTQFSAVKQFDDCLVMVNISNQEEWYTSEEIAQKLYYTIGQQVYYNNYGTYNKDFADRFTSIMIKYFVEV